MSEKQGNHVRNLFTSLAPEYDAHYRIPRCVAENSLLQRTIRRMLPVQDGVQPWPPRILDLGCGTGLGADLLKAETLRQPYGKRGADLRAGYVGVDMCKEMLVRARRKHPDSRFVCGDIVCSSGDFGQVYDLVLCLYVLNYVARPRDVLKGIERALRIHGKALVVLCSRRWQPPEPSMGVSDEQWRKPHMWLASNWQVVAMTAFLKTLGVHRVWGFSYLPPSLVDRLNVPQSVLSKYVQLEAATLGRWRAEDGQYMVVEMEKLP